MQISDTRGATGPAGNAIGGPVSGVRGSVFVSVRWLKPADLKTHQRASLSHGGALGPPHSYASCDILSSKQE